MSRQTPAGVRLCDHCGGFVADHIEPGRYKPGELWCWDCLSAEAGRPYEPTSHEMADQKKCGAGLKEHCCAYLLLDPEGFLCGRATSLANLIRARVENGEQVARRLPTEEWPNCQLKEH